MTTRDEYVARLKQRLDRWNEELTRWEADAKTGKARQLEALQLQRDAALYQLKLVEAASASAWKELAGGADKAWDELQGAVAEARKHFGKAPASKHGA